MQRTIHHIAALGVLWASSALAQTSLKIDLRFVPDSGLRPETWKPKGVAIALGPITDARGLSDSLQIGESQALGPQGIPVVSSSLAVPAFVEQALRVSLAEWKLVVSADAPFVLRAEVLELWALEKKRVAANVRIRFHLEDRGGNVLWEGELAADDSTWGKTHSEKNYIQVLSTATERAIADLFDKKAFQVALLR